MGFEKAYEEAFGVSVEEARRRGVWDIESCRMMFQAGMRFSAEIVRARGREVLGAVNPEITAKKIEAEAAKISAGNEAL